MNTMMGRVSLVIGAVFFLVFGLWAFLAPSSFFANVAPWEPYNGHFLRDAGALQLGLGAAVVKALLGWRGTVVALLGATAAAVFHAISHIVDFGDGGRNTDPYLLGLFAVLVGAGLAVEARRSRR